MIGNFARCFRHELSVGEPEAIGMHLVSWGIRTYGFFPLQSPPHFRISSGLNLPRGVPDAKA